MEINIRIVVTRVSGDFGEMKWKNEFAVEVHIGTQVVNIGNFDNREDALDLIKSVKVIKTKR